MLSLFLTTVIGLGCLPLLLPGEAQSATSRPSTPGLSVFESDFELGELEDPSVKRLSALNFLEKWQQRFAIPDLPRFMAGWLVRGAPQGDRYLALPLEGGRALLEARREVSLTAGAYLRASALGRWGDLGSGEWRLDLYATEDQILTLLSGTGSQTDWRTLVGQVIVPEGATLGRLRIRLTSEPGRVGGELGLDDIRVEIVPRLAWEWRGALRRLHPSDTRPLTLRSVGLPPGRYDLDLRVLDSAGEERFRERRTRLVGRQFPIEFTPHWTWNGPAIERGIYTVRVHLTRPGDDAWELTEERRFVLAGELAFGRVPGTPAWGVELDSFHERPWFSAADPDRVLVQASPEGIPTNAVPSWLFRRPDVQLGVVLSGEEGWNVEALPKLYPMSTQLRRCFWRGPGTDPRGRAVLTALNEEVPFLELGYLLPEGKQESPTGEALITVRGLTAGEISGHALPKEPWSVRLDLRGTSSFEPEVALAVSLYLWASRNPRTIYLAHPEGVFVTETRHEGAVPEESLLVWEFISGFLSGASFEGREEWDAESYMLLLTRDGEEFLLVLTDGEPHELAVYGGTMAVAYDSVGRSWPVPADKDGRCRIPVTREPSLIRGLDFPRVRTVRSLSASVDGGRGKQNVRLSLTNRYPGPVRASLTFSLPPQWEAESSLEPRRIDSEDTSQWTLAVRVPPSVGIDGPLALEGTLAIESPTGVRSQTPVTVPIVLESPLVEVRPLGIGNRDADVVIVNRSDERLVLTVYLNLEPGERERTWYQQSLGPGEERTYHLAYPLSTAADRKLWVGVVIPQKNAYVNRSFAVK